MRRVSLLVCMLVVAVGSRQDVWAQFDGGEQPKPSPWKISPPRDGEVSEKDRRARKTLLKLIEEKQTDDFRRTFRVVVPNKPTGLPDDYDVLMYGEYVGILLLRLEVQVRGDRATGELVTVDGIRRGTLPVESVDELARQLAYAYQAQQKRRPEADSWVDLMWSGAHHVRQQRIELISRDPKRPLHLCTEAWEPIADVVCQVQMGVQGFAHTRMGQTLEDLARDKLEMIQPSEDLGREVVGRLRRIRLDKKPPAQGPQKPGQKKEPAPWWSDVPNEQLPLDDSRRDDRKSIEAKLYSRLAVDWRLEEALPELRRLQLHDAATRLGIAVAKDPVEPLKAALVGEDWRLFRWSLDFATLPTTPDNVEVLLYALPRLKDGFRVDDLLDQLRLCKLNTAQLGSIRKFYSETEDPRSKVAAASFLLRETKQDEYFDFLVQEALKPQEDQEDIYAPQRDAIQAILHFASVQGRRRKESAAMVRTLLARIPLSAHADYSGMRTLVSNLGTLGEPDDLPLLTEYLDHGDGAFVVTVIYSIAALDVKLALEKARAQMRKYIEGVGRRPSFCWYVEPYLDLAFWQDDKRSAPLIEKALAKYRNEEPDRDTFVAETRLLLEYLKGGDVHKRAQAAVGYARHQNYISGEWLKDVGKRLVREGADPKRCEPLLNPAPKRLLDWLDGSREGEPW